MLCPSPDGVAVYILQFYSMLRAKHSMTGIPSKDHTNAWPLRIGCHISVPCLASSDGVLPRILEFRLAKKENVGAKHFIKQPGNYGVVEMLGPSSDGVAVYIMQFYSMLRAKHSMTRIPSKDHSNAWPLRIGCHISVPCLASSDGVVPRILEFRLAKKENVGAKHFIKRPGNFGVVEMLCPSPDRVAVYSLQFYSMLRAKHSMTRILSKDCANA